MDCIENDPDAFIPKKELYKIFALYCRVKKLPAVSADTFYKSLLKHISLADYRPKLAGTRVTAFKGIRYSSKILSLLAEAREAGLSDASSVSAVFYSLIERREEYERMGYKVEVVDESYIKVWIALDRLDALDTLDTTKEKASFVERGQPTLDMEQNKLFSESLADKLPKLRSWIYTHRDSEGLVDVQELAVQIRELGLDVLQTVQILKNDGVIFDSPKLGRFGVK